jgi:hypothetical protein
MPLLFDCSFIVHLQEDGPGKTRVEVLEFNPRVRFGVIPGIGHGGVPGLVPNTRLVPPTTSDRVEMLGRIQMLGGNP